MANHRKITLSKLLNNVYEKVPVEPTLVAVEVENGMVQIMDSELVAIQMNGESQPVLVLKPQHKLYVRDDEDSFLSQQREDLTVGPQITEQEVNQTFYTSYVANIKNLPPDVVPVVFDYLYDDAGIRYRKLAPTFASYHWWKHVHHDNNIYAEEYKQLILDRRDPLLVRDELLTMTHGKAFCLVSEEKPGEFSLRHIVAEWMRKAGIDIQEYQNTSITH